MITTPTTLKVQPSLRGTLWTEYAVLSGVRLVALDYWGTSHIATLTAPEHAQAVIDLYESTYDCDEPEPGWQRSSWDEKTAFDNGWITEY